MGKKIIKSTVLSGIEEEAIVEMRKMRLLPLDDLLHVLKKILSRIYRVEAYIDV